MLDQQEIETLASPAPSNHGILATIDRGGKHL
jgi:hypothetical protein